MGKPGSDREGLAGLGVTFRSFPRTSLVLPTLAPSSAFLLSPPLPGIPISALM